MSCNILIVEDEPLARRSLAIFLERASHTVHQAENGEAALDLISRVDFKTIISDFRLPGKVNGMDVLRHQNETAPGKRLILVTAFGSDEVESQAKEMGAVYLEKPISLAELLNTVDAAC